MLPTSQIEEPIKQPVAIAANDNPVDLSDSRSNAIAHCQFNFHTVMELIERSGCSLNYNDLTEEYNVSCFQLDRFRFGEIRELYNELTVKWDSEGLTDPSRQRKKWYENELRIFVWLLFRLEESLGRKIRNFVLPVVKQTAEDWAMLASCFISKPVQDCRYEWLMLIKTTDCMVHWTEEEDELLLQAIKLHGSDSEWNAVSRELFKLAEQRFFRKPKQCRERWRNYHDTSIKKGDWQLADDIRMLELVVEKGRKWSLIAKEMGDRTEHAVKNRFHSLSKHNKFTSKPGKRRLKKAERQQKQSEFAVRLLRLLRNGNDQSIEELEKPEQEKKRPTSKPVPTPISFTKMSIKEEPQVSKVPTTPLSPHSPSTLFQVSWVLSPLSPMSSLPPLTPMTPLTPLTPYSGQTFSQDFSSWIYTHSPFFTQYRSGVWNEVNEYL